jgi:hypothetical protein
MRREAGTGSAQRRREGVARDAELHFDIARGSMWRKLVIESCAFFTKSLRLFIRMSEQLTCECE